MNYVIILAAGVGNRLGAELPKQFLLLGNKPVLMHTIEKFHTCRSWIFDIIVVLHNEYVDYWKELCEIYDFNIPHRVVIGGTERFFSVKNALDTLPNEGIVGIHDGVRPFVTHQIINDTYRTAQELGNAVPAVPATNTIRFYDGSNSSQAMDRSQIFIVQNPQVFKITQLKAAYSQPYTPIFTDDAVVAELFGVNIHLTEGDQRNIKITHPSDMDVAHGLLNYNNKISIENVIKF